MRSSRRCGTLAPAWDPVMAGPLRWSSARRVAVRAPRKFQQVDSAGGLRLMLDVRTVMGTAAPAAVPSPWCISESETAQPRRPPGSALLSPKKRAAIPPAQPRRLQAYAHRSGALASGRGGCGLQ